MFDGDLDIPCPECGHKTPIPVRELQAHPDPRIVCGGCGKTIQIKSADFRDKLNELQKSYDEMKKKLKDMGFKFTS